ncbi:MAG: anion-transporting ATPase [Ktedonobacterales bacterium]|nr:MAG: anion-transporting ATPase [Ktedonobacterales bacterium]
MRLILYLGKGGVGKTTLAAATAARSAQLGKRTLVVSTDLAHSLADALDTTLGSEPKRITSNLWAQEINALDEIRSHWASVQDYVTGVLKKQGINDVAAEEMALIPGMDEIVALLNIHRQAQDGAYDVVVIDAAPTGETVRLLSMPETFLWYANQAKGWRNLAMSAAKPLLKTFLPGVNVLESLQKLNEQVAVLRGVLTDPDTSSYRLVVNPEKMVIKEGLRAETYLALFGYPIDGVLCNRVLPTSADGEYHDALLREMVAQQRVYYDQIHSTFAPLPVWDAPYHSREILGADALATLASEIWDGDDPTRVYFRGSPQELVKRGDTYVLRLPLPHVEMGKVGMVKKGDELIVEIGNFKRDIALPTLLAPMEATVARMVDSALEVTFTPVSAEQPA